MGIAAIWSSSLALADLWRIPAGPCFAGAALEGCSCGACVAVPSPPRGVAFLVGRTLPPSVRHAFARRSTSNTHRLPAGLDPWGQVRRVNLAAHAIGRIR